LLSDLHSIFRETIQIHLRNSCSIIFENLNKLDNVNNFDEVCFVEYDDTKEIGGVLVNRKLIINTLKNTNNSTLKLEKHFLTKKAYHCRECVNFSNVQTSEVRKNNSLTPS